MSEPTNSYFVQLQDQPDCFEEVDEFVFQNRKNCLKGIAYRYGECAFSRENGTITFVGNFSVVLLSRAMRILNISQPVTTGNGWCHKPESVVVKRKKGEILYDLVSKTKWKKTK